jgi:hypothetical protein
MPSSTYRWKEFPFAIAGPLALVVYAGTTAGGALSLAYAPPRDQFWIGLAVAMALMGSLEIARRTFTRRRKLTAPPFWMPTGRGNQVLVVGAALIAVIVPQVLGWHGGAVWVLFGITFYGQELYRLLRWRAGGYPGAATSGWAITDRRESDDPPA